MRIDILLLSVLLLSFSNVFGQTANNMEDPDAAYTRTINKRAEKIVATLDISDSLKAKHLIAVIAGQYRNLNTIYSERDEQIKSIKQKGLSKDAADSAIKNVQNTTDKKTGILHSAFLKALSSELSPEQVTKVKDGMTYSVLHVTYDAYVDMIPSLTREQKEQIMDWLVEAREHAMDGESSEKKHWWFGKYKGRINNYLSAHGYDITKERKQWEQRIKQREAKTQNQS